LTIAAPMSKIEGVKLSVSHYEPASSARHVAVFLHGLASDQKGEKAVHFRKRLLKEGMAYATFDFRGHGKSEGEMRELTVTGLLEDCEQVIRPLSERYERVSLIGSSMGACAAAWYATLNPGVISSCALIAPALNFVGLLVDQTGRDGLKEWKKSGRLQFTNQYCDIELGYDMVRDWSNYPVSALASRYATPTLIVHGMKDDSISYLHSLSFTARASGAEIDVILLSDGDHRLTAHRDKLSDWIALYFARSQRP
jgi:alpha-beta hydrolase superfamily lysophospholipase